MFNLALPAGKRLLNIFNRRKVPLEIEVCVIIPLPTVKLVRGGSFLDFRVDFHKILVIRSIVAVRY